MRVCFASSEIFPYSKTGGLADVIGALTSRLGAQGQDVRVITPLYSSIEALDLVDVDFARQIPVQLGTEQKTFSLKRTRTAPAGVEIYFVDFPEFYGQRPIYTDDPDEPLRFALLCHATLLGCQWMGWSPDIIHCHDWQTSLIPLYMKSVYGWDRLFQGTRTVLTIHNLGYQGVFPASIASHLLPVEHHSRFDADDLQAGHINFLKTGLRLADYLTTVSPTYAAEIQTAEFGYNLDKILHSRADTLSGILNGVEYEDWSPEHDPHIAFPFTDRGLLTAKRANKKALLKEVGLPFQARIPLLGIVSRLVWQKGFDLLFEILAEYLESQRLQLVVLGSGEPRYQEFFSDLAAGFPDQMALVTGYRNPLAHRIEAGSDMFLMPSRYEPCGLNQMYSLKYGTIPIVRKTGGLADSVRNFDPETGGGTGFVFEKFESKELGAAIDRALLTFSDRPAWRRLVGNAVKEDFSWARQVQLYLKLYRALGQPGQS